jgi:hypothetical protein
MMPKTDSEEARRPKPLRDIVDPRCRKSSTDSDDPKRLTLRKERELPR